MVEHSIPPYGRNHTERDREHDGDEQPKSDELECRRKPLLDVLDDRVPSVNRPSEIAPDEITEIQGELRPNALVEAQFSAYLVDRALISVRGQEQMNRVAGQHPADEKRHDQDADGDRNQEQDALQYVLSKSHGTLSGNQMAGDPVAGLDFP